MADDRDRMTGRTEAVRRAYDLNRFPMATTVGPDHVYVACNAAYRELAGRAHRDTVRGPAGERISRALDLAWASLEPTDAHGLHAAPYLDDQGSVAGVNLTLVLAERMPPTELPEVVVAMQDALLPADLPVVPGLDLATRYLLAEGGGSGGDWFDALVRPDGRVALVVGDVVGHGVAASAAMGKLRAVLRGQLLGDRPLEEVMGEVDRFARREQEMQATTVCVVLADVVLGELEYCTAGHPPPLLVARDGHARFSLRRERHRSRPHASSPVTGTPSTWATSCSCTPTASWSARVAHRPRVPSSSARWPVT